MRKGPAVQRIGWILTVLIALSWLASDMPLPSDSTNDRPMVQTCWRRTVNGWEDAAQWFIDYPPRSTPDLHPVLLVLIQCAIIALVGFSVSISKTNGRAKPLSPLPQGAGQGK